MSVQEIPQFQFLFEAARMSAGYSLEEAARCCGISKKVLRTYEADCSDMPFELAMRVGRLYGVSLDWIFAGSTEECIRYNREVARLRTTRTKDNQSIGNQSVNQSIESINQSIS